MGFFREVEAATSLAPLAAFREYFGYVPAVYRAQSILPLIIQAEWGLATSIVFQDSKLSCKQKERLLLLLGVSEGNVYCATMHYQRLCILGEPEDKLHQLLDDYRRSDLSPPEIGLVDFAIKLCANGSSITLSDVASVQRLGWTDEFVLEAVLIASWAKFLSTASVGVGAPPDFPPLSIARPPAFIPPTLEAAQRPESAPYLVIPETALDQFAPFLFLREHFGYLPNVFRSQVARPDVIEAEANALRLLILGHEHLTRLQKERILLVVSAANRNTYFVEVHSETLEILGVPQEETNRIASEHRRARLDPADIALLDFALKLAREPSDFSAQDIERLHNHRYSDQQILEAVGVTSFANFLNTLQFGTGAKPDFGPRIAFEDGPQKIANLSALKNRPIRGYPSHDPDAEAVEKAKGGDYDAFEDLVNRHSRRVYRTLLGILGSAEEARDAMQDTFLKAFQHLGGFEGRSSFSTWLVSIANNTGVQLLRDRKPLQSIDDGLAEGDEDFRPRQIRAWTEDPEQLYSRAETRALVEESVMKLPAKYRVVVMLRDIEQLSIDEAATALGLGIPALKSRHLRGRLMLREALTPHFAATTAGGAA
jgi:RNA polymerase sigma-70 factor, ECF subfamily